MLSRDTGAPTQSISYGDDFTGSSRSVSLKSDAKVSVHGKLIDCSVVNKEVERWKRGSV